MIRNTDIYYIESNLSHKNSSITKTGLYLISRHYLRTENFAPYRDYTQWSINENRFSFCQTECEKHVGQ